MAEIYEFKILKNYYATQELVDITPTTSSLSQQVDKIEGCNFAFMLKTCSSTRGNFGGKFRDGRVSNFVNFGWFDMEWPIYMFLYFLADSCHVATQQHRFKTETCCREFFQSLCRELAVCPVWTAEPVFQWSSAACWGPGVTCQQWVVANRHCICRQLEWRCHAWSSESVPVMSVVTHNCTSQ